MRVVFVALGQEQLGISMLSAVLRANGHETALVFSPALFNDRYYFDIPVLKDVFSRDHLLVDEIAAADPDLIAFSVLTPTYQWALDIARAAREKTGAPVIFGGVHPSAVPEVCLENEWVDYVCVGEGEFALLALCEALERGEHPPREPIANLWWRGEPGGSTRGEPGASGGFVKGPRSPFFQDLDSLPFADKELWEDSLRLSDHYLIMTSRGCPYRCTFCFNNFFARLPGKGGGKYVRQRSVDHVMRELLWAKERYGIRYVDIEDDIFTVDKEWIREFTQRYRKEIGVPFHCLSHPRFMDRDIARWLKDAGCVHVQIGVQSADEEYKRKELLRWEKEADLEKALGAMAEVGLRVKLDHILGLPNEPMSAQEKARVLYAKYPPMRIQTFWLTYVPGIDLTKRALEQGVLTQTQVDEINRGKTRVFRHPHLEERVDAKAAKDFYQRYDLLFRLMPLLPAKVRERARAEQMPVLPERLNNAALLALDVINSFGRVDLEAVLFAKHYGEQLVKAIPEVLGRRSVKSPPVRSGVEHGRR
ncbi:MAG: cobalamin-dependent protein [Archangium sp.]|nr:cobalamin-dependent protein [Archangium sp.]